MTPGHKDALRGVPGRTNDVEPPYIMIYDVYYIYMSNGYIYIHIYIYGYDIRVHNAYRLCHR